MQSNGLHYVSCAVSLLHCLGQGSVQSMGEGGEALSGRTSNEHAWFFFSLSLSSFFVLFRSRRQTLSLLITKQEGKINVCCHVCPAKATTTTGRWWGRGEESRVHKRMLRTLRK